MRGDPHGAVKLIPSTPLGQYHPLADRLIAELLARKLNLGHGMDPLRDDPWN
jgi:hypothetical protein